MSPKHKSFLRQLVDDRYFCLFVFFIILDVGLTAQIASQTVHCTHNGLPAPAWDQGSCDVTISESAWTTIVAVASAGALIVPLINREESPVRIPNGG